jgi:hypothetical protein
MVIIFVYPIGMTTHFLHLRPVAVLFRIPAAEICETAAELHPYAAAASA